MTARAPLALALLLAACGGPEPLPASEPRAITPADASVEACVGESGAALCQGRCGRATAIDRCGTERALECAPCEAALPVYEARCADGLDDDGDASVDCLDPDCLASPECAAVPGATCARQRDCGDVVDEMVTDVCVANRCQAPGPSTATGEAITAQVGLRLVFGASLTGPVKPRASVLRFVDSRKADGSALTCAELLAKENCRDAATRSRIDEDPAVNQVYRAVFALDFSGCTGTECVFPNLFASVPRGQGFLLYSEAWFGPRELNEPTGQCAAVTCVEGLAVASDQDRFQVTFR